MTIKTILLMLVLLLSIAAEESMYANYLNSLSYINYCGSTNRQQLINNINNIKQSTSMQLAIESTFPANKSLMVNGLIKQNATLVMQSIKGHEGLYILHIGIVALFLIIHIILLPILLLSKCCNCCQFCRKKQNENYTKFQMCWPTTCVLLLIIALITISAILIKMQVDLTPKLNQFKCSLSLITNDIIEGGRYQKSNKQIKFMGLNNFLAITNGFTINSTKINVILKKDLISQSKTMKSIKQLIPMQIDMISRIPSQDKSQLILQYANPLLSSITTLNQMQNSTFINELGSANRTGSLVANISQSSKTINTTVFNISTYSDELSKLISYVPANNISDPVKQQIDSFQQIQFQIQNSLGIAQSGILKVYTIGTYILLGIIIFVCLVLCLSAACMSIWGSYASCVGKYMCCCGVLWFAGILLFALAILYGFSNPVALYGCRYAKQTFSSPQYFQLNTLIFNDKPNPVSSTIKNCLQSSKQNYMQSIIISQSIKNNISKIQNLNSSMNINNINVSSASESLLQSYLTILNQVQLNRVAAITDLPLSSMIQQIKYVANYSNNQTCFPDRWVPSLKQTKPVLIGCSNFKDQANNDTCQSIIGFQQRILGCVGCIDTFSMLSTFQDQIQMKRSLNSRYKQCQKSNNTTPVQNLMNLWANYYKPKNEKLKSVKERILNVQSNINMTNKLLDSQIKPSFSQVQSWVMQDPLLQINKNTSYIYQSMDCRVLGISINNSIKSACDAIIPFVYVSRIMYYTAAFILLFICLISLCMLNRMNHQYKATIANSDKLDNKNAVVNVPPSSERRQTLEQLSIDTHPYFK